jgi:hypothetical protein
MIKNNCLQFDIVMKFVECVGLHKQEIQRECVTEVVGTAADMAL